MNGLNDLLIDAANSIHNAIIPFSLLVTVSVDPVDCSLCVFSCVFPLKEPCEIPSASMGAGAAGLRSWCRSRTPDFPRAATTSSLCVPFGDVSKCVGTLIDTHKPNLSNLGHISLLSGKQGFVLGADKQNCPSSVKLLKEWLLPSPPRFSFLFSFSHPLLDMGGMGQREVVP